jgi:adenine-specific DNA-methyltransferase
VEVAKERIRLAEEGQLRIRPMTRPVYDPDTPEASVPPQVIQLGTIPRQLKLLERHQKHTIREQEG